MVRRNPANGNGTRGKATDGSAGTESSEEVWQAVKTLLQLHDYLQSAKSSEEEPPL